MNRIDFKKGVIQIPGFGEDTFPYSKEHVDKVLACIVDNPYSSSPLQSIDFKLSSIATEALSQLYLWEQRQVNIRE